MPDMMSSEDAEIAEMIAHDPRMEDLKDSLMRVAAGAEDAVPGQAGPAAAAAFMFGLHVGLEFSVKHPADAASMASLIATMDAVEGSDPSMVSAYYMGLLRE